MEPALIAAFLALGTVVGFLAGLLGLGGGMTMVPILTFVFTRQGLPPEHVVHIAIATATATILFTSAASVREHQRHHAILWSVVVGLVPGLIIGSLLGPLIVGTMSTAVLSGFFGVFVAAAATNIWLDRQPKPTHRLPGRGGLIAVGAVISVIASMVGAGGAFMTVPFLAACNVPVRNCVATSAAVGLPVAATATAGFVIAGLRETGMPPHTLGYVHVPALLVIVAASIVSAPFGARAAHRWPVKRLKRVFAVVLYALAAHMLWKAIGPAS
jgi:uncharacterized membrane protein YfcA